MAGHWRILDLPVLADLRLFSILLASICFPRYSSRPISYTWSAGHGTQQLYAYSNCLPKSGHSQRADRDTLR